MAAQRILLPYNFSPNDQKALEFIAKTFGNRDDIDMRTQIINSGFDREHVRYIFKSRKKEIAAAIIDEVEEGAYDIVVLNHKPGKVTRFFTGNTYIKVVTALKDTTICVVS